MKIFIFGSNGMLGNYMKSYLSKSNKEIINFTRNELDISKVTYAKIINLLSTYKLNENDVIINCVGIIPQSKNMNDTSNRNYFLINSMFPNMLSAIAYINKVRFIHITTDCVYSGSKGNYTELDEPDEINNYGVSKSLGELGYNSTIIRTSIIGEEFKNKYSLLEWVKNHNNTNIQGFLNHFWNGVTCLQLSKIVNKMIDEKIWWTGVRHIHSPKSVSKFDLVSMINSIYQLNNNIEEYKTEESVNKTLSSIYDTNELFIIPELEIQITDLKNYNF